MPSLAEHQSFQFTKLLVMGDSGTGKTGMLVALVKAGYKLAILDFDNGLDVLVQFILKECPDKLGNVFYVTLRNQWKSDKNVGYKIDGKPDAFPKTLRLLDHWKDGEIDLGDPGSLGPDWIVVIDSFTGLSDSAYEFYEPLTPAGKSGDKDDRATYYSAQEAVEKVLSVLTSKEYQVNVIVNAHVRFLETAEGSKGYPMSVGKALSPKIPTYFNTVVATRSKGGKREIVTVPTALLDLKNPRPFDMGKHYSIETGIAEVFEVLRQSPPVIEPKVEILPPVKQLVAPKRRV